MRRRVGRALSLIALAAVASPAAHAFDRVLASHASDPGVLQGVKTPIKAEVRSFGPWQVQLAAGGQAQVAPFEWQLGVPVPFHLDWDGEVATLAFGDGIAFSTGPQKKERFDAIVVHARSDTPGYSIRLTQPVLNVSSAGIGGPLAVQALADEAHPDDLLLLRGVGLVPGF